MKLLLDQDVYAITARFLGNLGFDVVLAGQISRPDYELTNPCILH